MKLLLANHKNAGPIDGYARNLQARSECVKKKMLGHLVEAYATEVLYDARGEPPKDERQDDWITFSFKIGLETDFLEGIRKDLKLMTDERNDLVHHFLPRWQPDNEDEMTKALAYLDEQREKVLPMHEHLRTMLQHLSESATMFAEFVASPEYKKQTKLMWLQASPLVTLMRGVAARYHREDGWTYLDHAGNLAAREMPVETKNIKERYGFKSLKKLLIGAEVFELMDEKISDESVRTLYRNKAST